LTVPQDSKVVNHGAAFCRFLAVCCIAREASLLCAHIAETAAHYQSADPA
jgi:hypothetical protein